MKLKFIINKYELAAQIFNHRMANPANFPFWRKLEEKLWAKYKDEPALYFIYPKHLDWAIQMTRIDTKNNDVSAALGKIGRKINAIYREIFVSTEFKKIFSETNLYLKKVENQWRKNYPAVSEYLDRTLGIKIPPTEISVLVLHPRLYSGKAIPDKKTILWGHSEDWKNYSTVYLAHEILHIILEKKYLDYDLNHALIELATDNELRIRLNKKGRYFEANGHPVGHKHLRMMAKKILPFWKSYLRKPSSIILLESQIKKALV